MCQPPIAAHQENAARPLARTPMKETREVLLKRPETEARHIRRNVWRALRAGGGGHAGGLLLRGGCPRRSLLPPDADPARGGGRDRVVLSKGHANAALGAVLAQAGFIEDGVLDQFYGFESPFAAG
jgi:transketolase N-terminal domain/subunit